MTLHNRSKLTREDQIKVYKWYKSGRYTQANLARSFSVSPGTIRTAIRIGESLQKEQGDPK